MLRGQAWLAPHRDHAYQRLVRAGRSHAAVAAAIALASAALTAAAVAVWPGLGGRAGWALLAMALGLFVTEAAVARHRDAAVNAG
jgi:hypothetical protein